MIVTVFDANFNLEAVLKPATIETPTMFLMSILGLIGGQLQSSFRFQQWIYLKETLRLYRVYFLFISDSDILLIVERL